MGSFNTTCAVSNLPIATGDEVKMFFIVKSPYSDSSNNINQIIGLPFDVTYDDYGLYNLLETEYNLQVWEDLHSFLKERVLELEQGENKYHDCEVKVDNLTFDNIQNAIWEGRLQLKYSSFDGWTQEKLNKIFEGSGNIPVAGNYSLHDVNIFAVHKKIYESMSSDLNTFMGYSTLEDRVTSIKNHPSFKYYENPEELLNKEFDEDESNPEIKIQIELDMFNLMRDLHPLLKAYEDNRISLNNETCSGLRLIYDIKFHHTYVHELVQMYFFECNMNLLNKKIIPVGTSGQEYRYNDHIKFYESIVQVAKEKLKEREY